VPHCTRPLNNELNAHSIATFLHRHPVGPMAASETLEMPSPDLHGKARVRRRVLTPCAVVNSARPLGQPTWKDEFRNRRTRSNDRSGGRSTVGGLGDKRRRTGQTGPAPRDFGRRSTVRRHRVGSGRSVSVTRVRQQGRPAGKEDCNDVGTAIESTCHPTNVVPVLWEQGHRHAGKDNLSDDLVAVPWL
jgi:hypothetical protein